MKKLFILFAATLMASAAVNAQEIAALKQDIKSDKHKAGQIKKEKKEERKELRKLEGDEVSTASKNSFYSDFGDVPATWKREANFDEATFTKDGATMIAYYDYDANLVGTTTRKTFTDLPERAQKRINKMYTDYTKEKVILFDDNEFNDSDMLLYGHQFDDADNYFVELSKGPKTIVVKSNMAGDVEYFTEMK